MTTTATFREFQRLGDYLIINTDYTEYCRLSIVTDDVVRTAHLNRDNARELGTSLIAWSGSPLAWCEDHDTFATDEVQLSVIVEDGAVAIEIGGLRFELSDCDCDPDVRDLGQRLIVWAGVDAETADV